MIYLFLPEHEIALLKAPLPISQPMLLAIINLHDWLTLVFVIHYLVFR